jgi:hypothetical protein
MARNRLVFHSYLLAIKDACSFVVPEQEVGLLPYPVKNALLEHYFQLIVSVYV